MCSSTTLMSFLRILKLRTSPFYRTGTCNYSFQLNSSFITAHSSDSFTLSVFRFSSCSAMARNCLRRRTTRVLFRPYLDTDVSTVCSTGLSFISFNSLDDVDNVSEPTILSSSSLSEPEVEVSSRSGVPFSKSDKILLAICAFIYDTFSGFFPVFHDSMTYQVQIKFMNFQRRYLVRIIQLLSFSVVGILFQPLRLLPFTFSSSLFLTHFNLRKVINIVLHKLQWDNTVPRKFSYCSAFSWVFKTCFGGTFFSFELGAENHQVHDHR